MIGDGVAELEFNLLPDHDATRVLALLAPPRGKRSVSEWMRRRLRLDGIRLALLREVLARDCFDDPPRLARALKALPLRLVATRPLAEAISTAGGVAFEALDETLMLRAVPGVFCAGEMLDWEAPTGGYLLTAAFSTGRCAGIGAAAWADAPPPG